MKKLRTLQEATAAFLAYAPAGMKGKYSLERMRKLMTFLGNPQNTRKVIHIAGTSGKTSTAYFIRGFLEAAGKRTGLTVSPHIVAINERVQIAGEPLAAKQFLAYANDFFDLISVTDLKPTYFELVIAFAYWVFAKENVDYAVVETGLGGLLDGTNVVTNPNKVCVITDIGLDHTDILGSTVTAIAAQKAGIIQSHNQVLVRNQDPEIIQTITDYAHKQQANIAIVDAMEAPDNLPQFQHRNWAMAKATFAYLQQRDNVPALSRAQEELITHQTPPGRWEEYHYKGKTIILDGAHNPQKVQALYMSLRRAHISSAAVLANFTEVSEITKITDSLKMLQPITSHLIIPEFTAGQDLKSRHSVVATTLQTYAFDVGIASSEPEPDVATALNLLLARPENTLIITGSLYLVVAVRPLLQKLLDA